MSLWLSRGLNVRDITGQIAISGIVKRARRTGCVFELLL